MSRLRRVEDLSVDELRRLLVEKRRQPRQQRLEHFRKTGRAMVVASPGASAALDSLVHQPVMDEPKARPARRWIDLPLQLIEIAAVIGFIFVLYQLFNGLALINNEYASSFVQATLTPTPVIRAVVLPSGHTPPISSSEEVRPNDAEIPEHLRPLVQSLAQVPVPTAGPEQAVRIQISAITIDAPVVQGDGWEQLKKGVAQHLGGPNPGQRGNLVLSAHNDVFGQLFRDLDRLKPGDTVILYTSQRAYTYRVRTTRIVEPYQVEVMGPSSDQMLTLISCYPYRVDNKRIVVTALLQE